MRIEEKGAAAVSGLLDRIAATAAAELGPDVTVERGPDGVALTGAGLRVRRIVEARVRDLAVTAVRT